MTDRRATFRQADVSRALAGAIKAGLSPKAVRIDRSGMIVVELSESAVTASRSSWDDA